MTHLVRSTLCIFDGRNESKNRFKPGFVEPLERYVLVPGTSDIINKGKCEIGNIFKDVTRLVANYRLGQLLHMWKSGGNRDISPPDLARRFDSLFEDGDDAGSLELHLLGGKSLADFNQALLDALLYHDDNLCASVITLLDTIYGQRQLLLDSLNKIVLMSGPRIPVFDSVHTLREEIVYLGNLVQTSSRWGVFSRISGPFVDESFNSCMRTVDRLLSFLHFKDEASVPPVTDDPATLWSRDVATAWGKSDLGAPDAEYQNILRVAGIVPVLIDSLSMDYSIAFKGSICTVSDYL